jgi:thiol-disulfide isomerase/thioredoxin
VSVRADLAMAGAALLTPRAGLARMARVGAPFGWLLLFGLIAWGLARPDAVARAAGQWNISVLAAIGAVARQAALFFGPELGVLALLGVGLAQLVKQRGGKLRDPAGAAMWALGPGLFVLGAGGALERLFPSLPPLGPLRALSLPAALAALPLYLPALTSFALWARHELRTAAPAGEEPAVSDVPTDRATSIVFLSIAIVGALIVTLSIFERWDHVAAPASGQAAPSVVLPLHGGGTVDLAGLRGKVVVVDFWATWCPPCVRSLPNLDAVARELGPKGLVAIAVNRDDPGAQAELVGPFLKQYGLSALTIALDDGRAGSAFRVQALPTLFVIDRDGNIVASHVGGLERDELDELLRPLL